jgi:hypothetical protein
MQLLRPHLTLISESLKDTDKTGLTCVPLSKELADTVDSRWLATCVKKRVHCRSLEGLAEVWHV